CALQRFHVQRTAQAPGGGHVVERVLGVAAFHVPHGKLCRRKRVFAVRLHARQQLQQVLLVLAQALGELLVDLSFAGRDHQAVAFAAALDAAGTDLVEQLACTHISILTVSASPACGCACMDSISAAISASRGFSNNAMIDSSRSSNSRTRMTKRAASSECPPRAKKSSATSISSTPSSSRQIAATAFSVSVSGRRSVRAACASGDGS